MLFCLFILFTYLFKPQKIFLPVLAILPMQIFVSMKLCQRGSGGLPTCLLVRVRTFYSDDSSSNDLPKITFTLFICLTCIIQKGNLVRTSMAASHTRNSTSVLITVHQQSFKTYPQSSTLRAVLIRQGQSIFTILAYYYNGLIEVFFH